MSDELESRMGERDWTAIRALLIGIGYGLFARLVFVAHVSWLEGVFSAVSLAFLFMVPFALGVMTVRAAYRRGRYMHWIMWIIRPWFACVVLAVVLMLFAWEGAICIVMAAPIYLAMASFGGVVAGLALRHGRPRDGSDLRWGLVVALPFVVGPVEQRFAPPSEQRTVETSVRIAADADTVFAEVAEVPEIRPEEQRHGFFQRIGIPRPLAATLSERAVGGIRDARFVEGIRFRETITRYEPGRSLAFTIAVDPASISDKTLDEHVRVGGPYFDAEYGEFRIQPHADGTVTLHLSSRHRVTTHINFYAHLWTDAVMRDLQVGILDIVRQRSERVAKR